LPCEHSICGQHLNERDVVKQNTIKCKACSEDFAVKGNDFKSNEAFARSIESQSHLSGEEIGLKQELEASIQKFFEFYDEFTQNRTQLELDVFDHYQEMRFKIDQHREELKKRIDEISLTMIEQTKKYQQMYLKNLNETFSSFDESKSTLEIVLTEIEEAFRKPTLLIDSIQAMQQRQEESLNAIQLKLSEMSHVKEFLEKTNEFKPNVLDQKETTSLFGSIRLNAMSLESFKNSQLIIGEKFLEVINLCEFSPNDKWSLLYRGTRDGFGADDFHSNCDGHSNTLTICKAKQSSYIFGGFTTVEWDSSGGKKSDPNAFIFSLTNNDNKPVKMKIDPNYPQEAIHCKSSYGPTFSRDICIANNANTHMGSFTHLSFSYTHPQYAFETNEAQTFLAGSDDFLLDEIEVYQKE